MTYLQHIHKTHNSSWHTLVSHYISSRHTLFMLTIYLQGIAFTTYSLWVQDISARHIWHGILFYICLDDMCWVFHDISSRHIKQKYVSYVLKVCVEIFKTYPQDICVLQDISAKYICLEGMYWNMSRHILKTYMFFKTYLPVTYVLKVCIEICHDVLSRHMCSSRHILKTYMLHMSWRYVLIYVTTYPQDICVFQDISSRHINFVYVLTMSQDISSRHIIFQDIPSTHIYLNAHLHDIPSRAKRVRTYLQDI